MELLKTTKIKSDLSSFVVYMNKKVYICLGRYMYKIIFKSYKHCYK